MPAESVGTMAYAQLSLLSSEPLTYADRRVKSFEKPFLLQTAERRNEIAVACTWSQTSTTFRE